MLQNVIFTVVAAIRSKKGISALEYGILAAAVVAAVAAGATTLSTDISTMLTGIAGKLPTN